MKLDLGLVTDRGRTRSSNQDFVGASQEVAPAQVASKGRLLVVADGFGKEGSGQLASAAAVHAVTQAYYASEEPNVDAALLSAVRQANTAAYGATPGLPPDQAGTTLTAAVVRNGVVTIAHVGDSRAYLLNAGRLVQLTQDHSWAADQMRAGKLTAEQAAQHPKRSNLMRALGIQTTVQVDLATQSLSPGDVLLLCSDGLVDQVSEAEILAALRSGPAQAAAQKLVNLANQHGGGDNVSVIVAKAEAAPAAVAAPWLPWAIIGGAVALTLFVALLTAGPPPQVAQTSPTAPPSLPGADAATAMITQTVPLPTALPETTVTPAAPTPPLVASRSTPPPNAAIYIAPVLFEPADGAIFRGDREKIKLQWQSVGPLAADDYYIVITTFLHDGQVWQDEQQTKETELEVPAYLLALATDTHEFTWRVGVRRAPRRDQNNHLIGTPVSPESAVRRFTWQPAEPEPAATAAPQPVEPTAEPTEEPPPEPTATPGYDG